MITKNKIKFIKSLSIKKYRSQYGLFLAEGNKLVTDLFPFFECELLLAKPSFISTQSHLEVNELIIADKGDIEKATLLKNPKDVIAVFVQPKIELEKEKIKNELSLVLDDVQDPGNLGTIIRLSDWFGIKNIICSVDSVDVYNPKTIQASMGSIAHVNVFYDFLPKIMKEFAELPISGTFLDGKNIYCEELEAIGLIVMGNEGRGIRPELEQYINNRLHIPNFPPHTKSAESLNVAMATAITCAEFRRRQSRYL